VKTRDGRAARGERVRCYCCTRMVLVNYDGCVRGHRSTPCHAGDSGHYCGAGSGDERCAFYKHSAAEVAAIHRRSRRSEEPPSADAVDPHVD
jgi:hypothetical protein